MPIQKQNQDIKLLTIGVTGGIGSGKSSVCRILESHGAVIFYADEVAKRLMIENTDLRAEIIASFGQESYREDGSLNRAYLAGRIFSSEDDRKRMNALVHPAVGRAFRIEREIQRARGTELFVKEAALIFESGATDLDAVVVVDAPEEVRIKRVVGRDDAEASSVREQMRSQMAPDEMRMRSEFIIDNSKNREALKNQVVMLLKHLRESHGLNIIT